MFLFFLLFKNYTPATLSCTDINWLIYLAFSFKHFTLKPNHVSGIVFVESVRGSFEDSKSGSRRVTLMPIYSTLIVYVSHIMKKILTQDPRHESGLSSEMVSVLGWLPRTHSYGFFTPYFLKKTGSKGWGMPNYMKTSYWQWGLWTSSNFLLLFWYVSLCSTSPGYLPDTFERPLLPGALGFLWSGLT